MSVRIRTRRRNIEHILISHTTRMGRYPGSVDYKYSARWKDEGRTLVTTGSGFDIIRKAPAQVHLQSDIDMVTADDGDGVVPDDRFANGVRSVRE